MSISSIMSSGVRLIDPPSPLLPSPEHAMTPKEQDFHHIQRNLTGRLGAEGLGLSRVIGVSICVSVHWLSV